MVHLMPKTTTGCGWLFVGMVIILFLLTGMDVQARSYAYIANYGDSTVSVIDTATAGVVSTIRGVGSGPGGVAVSPGGAKIFISNYNGETVSVVDTATNVVTATIPVGTSPNDMAVLPDGSKVYVANSGSNSVSVISTASNTVTNTIAVGVWPVGAVAHPGGARVYVANRNVVDAGAPGTVSVIDTATDAVVAIIPVGGHPHHLALSPDGTRIYVANHQPSPSVSVIDTATDTVVATITGPGSPVNAAVTPDGSKVYVANRDHDNVTVIDAANNVVIAAIPVGDFPYGVAVVPDGSRVYVANAESGTVSIIDPATDTVIETMALAAGSLPYSHGSFITPSIAPPSGRVAWWKAEDNTADAMGFNNGTAHGNVTYAAGMSGRAFAFDGSASYVQAADSASLDLTTHFTLEAWVYPYSFSGGDKAIISKVGGAGGNNGYQLGLGSNDGAVTVAFCGFNASGESWPANWLTAGSVPVNAWSHVACTYDQDALKIYVNGIPIGSKAIGAKTVVNSSSSLRISGDDNIHVWFNGLIDEAAVYNRLLSAGEIAARAGKLHDFEADPAGTAGPAISGWTYDFYTMNDAGTHGANPTADHALTISGERSFSGSRSVHSSIATQVNCDNQDADRNYATHTLTYRHVPRDGLELSAVTLWRSDIAYTTASRYFYWFIADITDGTATQTTMLACRAWGNGEGCTNNFQDTHDQSAVGSDGQTWYRHRIPVPMGMNRDNLTVTVRHTERSWDCGNAQSSLYFDLVVEETVPEAAGMSALWHADGDGKDSVGSNHGTLAGGAAFAAGQAGQAFSLDGIDDEIPMASAGIANAVGFSLSFWVNVASFTHAAYMAPFSQHVGNGNFFTFFTGAQEFGFYGYWTDGTPFDLRTNAVGAVLPTPVGAGLWKHIAVTYDGATLKQYVDGIVQNQKGYAGKTLGNGQPLIIGRGVAYPAGSMTTTHFSGLVDEFAIFNRALSGREVAAASGTIPEPFPFAARTDATPASLVESEAITLSGIANPAAISVTGGEYAVSTDGGSIWGGWTNAAGTVNAGDRVKVRLTAPAAWAATAEAVLTIGGVSATFTVTTRVLPPGLWTDFRAASFAGGDGSAGTPYLIATAEELALLAYSAGSDPGWSVGIFFALTADIDLAPHQWVPVAEFRGNFNGRGHRISNLTIGSSASDYQGLFGKLTSGASVSNVGILDCYIVGNSYTGALAGFVSHGTITGCYSTGSIDGYSGNGGLVGGADTALALSRSWSSCAVRGRSVTDASAWSGGLVGPLWNATTTISHCFASGAVGQGQNSGGLVALTWGGSLTINNSYSTGQVTTAFGNWNNVGGLVGLINGSTTVTNSYHSGVVTGSDGYGKTGGILGGNDGAPISVTNSYYNSANPPGQGGGTALSTAEMRVEGFAAALNGSQSPAPWLADGDYQNGGFPLLAGLPTPYAFAVQTGVATATEIVSNALPLFDIPSPSAISLSACTGAPCQYRINNGEWKDSTGTVNKGDTVTVRLTSADAIGATTKVVLTIDQVGYPFSVTTVPPCSPTPAGLVSWWRAEGNARDAVGANHGALVNGVAFAAGEAGQAFSFNGVDGYVESTTPPLIGLSDTFTMAFWALPQGERTRTVESNAGVAGLVGQRYAILPEWGDDGSNAGAGVSVGTNGVSVVEHRASYIPTVLVYDAVLDGWTHIAVVYENKRPSLYVNGAWVRTGAVSAYSVFPSKFFGTFISLYGPYLGLLDEVGIYDRALADAEIAAIHGAGGGGLCPGSGCAKKAGDVNHDGTVTLADAILTLRIAVGSAPDAPGCAEAADVNADGRIGGAEALFILQSVAGLRP